MAIFRERSCYPLRVTFQGHSSWRSYVQGQFTPQLSRSWLRESASILQNCVCTRSVFPSTTPEEKLVMTQNRVAEMNVNPNDTDTLDTGRGWNAH